MASGAGCNPAQHRTTTVKGDGPVVGTGEIDPMAAMRTSTRVYAHIDDLLDVDVELDPHTPMRTVLQTAEQWARAADTHYDFQRPDWALREYLKASIAVVEIIPHHKDFPELKSKKDELHRQYVGLQRRIQRQDQKFKEVKGLIKDNNARSGVKPTSRGKAPRFSERPNGLPEAEDGIARNAHKERGSMFIGSADSGYGGSLDLHAGPLAPEKPAVQPKPPALHGNVVSTSGGNTSPVDLAARFARLRAADASSPVQDPRIRTRPITIPSQADHQVVNTAVLPSKSNVPRPYGPRESPSAPTATFKTVDANITMPTMPRAPDAIYAPSWDTEPVNVHLSSSDPRGIGIYGQRANPGNENIKTFGTSFTADGRDNLVTAHSATNPTPSMSRDRKTLDLPDTATITAEEVVEYNKKGVRILLVDIRDREQFDNGHIMSASIICVEPIILREDMSPEKLGECLVLSPEHEQKLYERRHQFDLVVFYDQSSRRIPQRYTAGANDGLRIFSTILYDHDFEKRLRRRPVLLVGGLDAWVDLVSGGSLQVTKTRSKIINGYTRNSVASRNLIAQRQRSISRPLSKEEEHKWNETLTNHERLKNLGTGDSGLAYARTTVDIFSRRFPPINLESMTIPSPSSSALQGSLPAPKAPTRPPPALPRHKSSGILDRPAQAAHTVNSSVPPLMTPDLPDKTIAPLGECGLENFHGKVCYMLSGIQALSQSPAISQFLRSYVHQKGSGPPMKEGEKTAPPQLMVRFLGNLIGHLWSGQYNYVQPKSFTSYVAAVHGPLHAAQGNRPDTCFGSCTTQHDAEEFLFWLFNIIEDELNPYRDKVAFQALSRSEADQRRLNTMPVAQIANEEIRVFKEREDSIISRLIRGLRLQTTTCTECHQDSRRVDSFCILQIPIKDQAEQRFEEALENEYGRVSILTGENAFFCNNCARKTIAEKRWCILHLPDYLIIGLNRTGTITETQCLPSGRTIDKTIGTKKVNTLVRFPQELDLAKYYRVEPNQPAGATALHDSETRYDCYAVLQHSGDLGGGHWWTLAKSVNGPSGRAIWREFNDVNVKESSWARTQSKASTMLFYRKKGAP